jgi:hypothetical protein
MAGLFGGSKMPPPPKAVRQPVESDPDVLAAARRSREGALRRTGRLSTMLTEGTQGVGGIGELIGSSGERLGA